MKKLSSVVSRNTEETYKKFITEKVLRDPEVIQFIRENNFTRDDVENNLEKFYQYYITKDSKLNIEHSPKLVFNGGEVHLSYSESESYKTQRQSKTFNSRIKTEFIPKKVLSYTFQNLSKNREKIQLAQKIIKACDEILSGKSKKGIYLYGPTGTGKTFLMGAVYNYFCEKGKEPTILYYPEFLRKIRGKFKDNEYEQYIDFIMKEEILIIDDIGAEKVSDFSRDDVLGPIINFRESEDLPTFFSSNLDYKELLDLLSNSTASIDGNKAVRIVERIKSLSQAYYFEGENERDYN